MMLFINMFVKDLTSHPSVSQPVRVPGTTTTTKIKQKLFFCCWLAA